MKAARPIAKLRARLADAVETLRAIRTGELPCSTCIWSSNAALRTIRNGEVDAVVVAGKQGAQVFTLRGAEHAYRVLIESMNEGALTLTAKGAILYANQCFAKMVKRPLEQVLGSSFQQFVSAADWASLRPLLKRAGPAGAKTQMLLQAGNGSQLPVHCSIRLLPENSPDRAAIGMVVTDMTEARHNEEMLRALTHRVVEVQEAERERVALELHNNITQHLCAVLAHWQALANKLPAREKAARRELLKLSRMLGQTVDTAQGIARNLRPSVLDELGLVPALRAICTEFAKRTGVSTKLACQPLTGRVHAEDELALYRILQNALENVEKHAHARHVTVGLRQRPFVQLTITDDGIGFDPERYTARRKKPAKFGLLSMRERATYVGGDFQIKSVHGTGTEIDVRFPSPAIAKAPKGTHS